MSKLSEKNDAYSMSKNLSVKAQHKATTTEINSK